MHIFTALQDSPVFQNADAVRTALSAERRVLITNAATGSGKTLLVPALLHTRYPHARILVLEPSRFLAINAAQTFAQLNQTPLRQPAGFCVGKRGSRGVGHMLAGTHITYMTYTLALKLNAIYDYDIIVLDEVHEGQLDQSLVEALLHARLQQDPRPRVVVMSGTMDLDAQVRYWEPYGVTTLSIPGAGHPVLVEHTEALTEPAALAAYIHDQLVVEHGRRGILVFLDGVELVYNTVRQLRQCFAQRGVRIAVRPITGVSDADEVAAATATPDPNDLATVLVGTSVLESGVNLPWVDAGISNGMTKELEADREVMAPRLAATLLTQWQLTQQKGRVGRCQPGHFVLAHPVAWDKRPHANRTALQRLGVTSVVLHCTSLGIDARQLRFNPPLPVAKITQARQHLERRGVIRDGALTSLGRLAQRLPVRLESVAMLHEAERLGLVAQTLPMIAAVELVTRVDVATLHDDGECSDVLHRTRLLASVLQGWTEKRQPPVFKSVVTEARDLLDSLEQHYGVAADLSTHTRPLDPYLQGELLQVLIAGYWPVMGAYTHNARGPSAVGSPHFGTQAFCCFDRYSVMAHQLYDSREDLVVLGRTRQVVPQRGKPPFVVLGTITVVPVAAVLRFVDEHPELLTLRVTNVGERLVLTTTALPRPVLDMELLNPVDDDPATLTPAPVAPVSLEQLRARFSGHA